MPEKAKTEKKSRDPQPAKSVTIGEQDPAAVDVEALVRVLPKKKKGKKGTRER